ncbi:glutamate receptor ionotropic, kainate 2 [Anastrepha obliqua]|uniref:glutamate receptor ionotropic, kainate 2 n=1 Tax=Anastrepha obliqua TaxID=95512 RepID=UPI00240A3455|nr:glutamate receptor ionotropic, kainate 2 [Anastrepha obliqua]
MWKYWIIVAWIFICVKNALALQQVNIGAIFYEDEFHLERTFIAIVKDINNERDNNFKMLPLIRRVSETDGSMILQREACDLIDNGVSAIFGPSSKIDSDIVSVICNNTGIPHIQFDISYEETTEEKLNHQMTLNVYPAQLMLSKAYADIVQNFGWRKFAIVYDGDDPRAPTRLQDLLQLQDIHKDVVRVRVFKRGDDFRIMWKSIKGERRVLLDCNPDLLVTVLNASVEFDLTGQFNHLFLTNLDTHIVDLEELRDNVSFAVNITAARLRLNGDFYSVNVGQRASLYEDDPLSDQPIQTLLHNLLYDAVNVFANAIRNVSYSYQIRTPRVRCDFTEYGRVQPWAMGRYIYRVMKATSGVNNTDYRSTDLQFDEDGQRVNFGIEIFEPMENYGIAFWDPKGQIVPQHVEAGIAKKIVYRVATRIGEPYFTEIPEMVEQNVTGNERYMGYTVDLIKELANLMNFEYLFVPVRDNQYGKYNKETKQWNGIIGELINNDAHMGLCDLTITQLRRTAVDFTVPFMQLGVSILAYEETPEKKKLLAFLDPLNEEVWMYTMVAIYVVSFLFVFSARIAEDEWENPHPCNKDPEVLENKWGLLNTFYLTAASIMQAGCDILPKSAPFRTFTAMWWIIAVIFPNSYTANMAAFLTSSKMEGSVTDLKTLAEQTDVKFGTLEGGSTYTLFAESNETVYRLAFNMMNNQDNSVYTKDNKEGVERVLKSNGTYMFLMETTTLEYNIERSCELRMVGEKFGEKHYAIAVPFGAEYRYNLSVNILKLSETGKLFDLKNRWWKNKTSNCNKKAGGDNPDLGFQEVRGIFYTLFFGLFTAFCFGICEFLMHTHERACEENLRFKEVFVNEMRFVFRIWNNRKPVSCTPTASLTASSRRSSNRTIKSSKKKNSRESSATSEELRDLVNFKSTNNGSIIEDAKI